MELLLAVARTAISRPRPAPDLESSESSLSESESSGDTLAMGCGCVGSVENQDGEDLRRCARAKQSRIANQRAKQSEADHKPERLQIRERSKAKRIANQRAKQCERPPASGWQWPKQRVIRFHR